MTIISSGIRKNGRIIEGDVFGHRGDKANFSGLPTRATGTIQMLPFVPNRSFGGGVQPHERGTFFTPKPQSLTRAAGTPRETTDTPFHPKKAVKQAPQKLSKSVDGAFKSHVSFASDNHLRYDQNVHNSTGGRWHKVKKGVI
jgi:hypothetical protein